MRVHYPTSQQLRRGCVSPASTISGYRPRKSARITCQEAPWSKGTALNNTSLLKFERQGHLAIKGLLSKELISELSRQLSQVIDKQKLQALKHRIRVLCPGQDGSQIRSTHQAERVLRRQATDELGFLQFFNTHRECAACRQVVTHPMLVAAAAQLLGVPRLRLYQDCVFLKLPGYAATNWHSDLRMAPLDCNAFVTAWIPLRPVRGEEDSGLLFAQGSHRDFALPFWHDLRSLDLQGRGYPVVDMGPMAMGDVSFHHGWTLHSAGPLLPSAPQRVALAVSFFGDGARVLHRTQPSLRREMLQDEDAESYTDWLQQLPPGAPARHKLLPLVYPAAAAVPDKVQARSREASCTKKPGSAAA